MPPLADMVADRRFRDRPPRQLGQDPLVNPSRRVTLLARRHRIGRENGIDERHHRSQGRLGARAIATQRRQGALHRLAHHPAMNAERPRHTLHRADPELVLAAQPLEQFHLRSPVHTAPRTSTAGRRTLGHTRRGGPTFTSTGGPSFDSEAKSPSTALTQEQQSWYDRPEEELTSAFRQFIKARSQLTGGFIPPEE